MTKTQRAVLERLAAGDPILVLTGDKPKAFFLHGNETVRLNTLQVLKQCRFVKQTAKNVNAVVEMTPAGERALMIAALRRKRRRVPAQSRYQSHGQRQIPQEV